jgi:hypothetical protein
MEERPHHPALGRAIDVCVDVERLMLIDELEFVHARQSVGHGQT